MFKTFFLICAAGILTMSSAILVENKATASLTAAELVNILAGPHATISNASISGTSGSIGKYSGATVESQGNKNLENGIILSTGDVEILNSNSNTAEDISTTLQKPGDSQLGSLFPDFLDTYDATILEFDITASTDGVGSIWYVFGSDEYEEYSPSWFNDVFAIFLDDVNIATLPVTNEIVSINTVNQITNTDLYVSNSGDYATEMDGFTIPLHTEFAITAGSTHHVKIGIADVEDLIWDSWVLIGNNCFSFSPTSVPEPATASLVLVALFFLAIAAITVKPDSHSANHNAPSRNRTIG